MKINSSFCINCDSPFVWAKHNIQRPFFLKSFTTTGSPNDFQSELQNISSSLCFNSWRNSGSTKDAIDDKSVHCGGICPRILIQWCAHKWASNLAPYIDSQIRQFRKQRLRGEAWVTCEVKYKRVKQKKTKRMMMEEGMIFSSVFPKRSEFCNTTLSYHGIWHRNFLHAVTKRKFLRLNQCLRKIARIILTNRKERVVRSGRWHLHFS